MTTPYNYKNCQSLFGYAFKVHVRSNGTCQLCFCGGSNLNFDLWRQLTVEHIIGKKQGGYLKNIRQSVNEHFKQLTPNQCEDLAKAIDAANTVTACSFCNSTTSQNSSETSMGELIQSLADDPSEIIEKITIFLDVILAQKRVDAQWKLNSIRQEYGELFLSKLSKRQHAILDDELQQEQCTEYSNVDPLSPTFEVVYEHGNQKMNMQNTEIKNNAFRVFDGDDKAYLAWINKHSEGYILTSNRCVTPSLTVIHHVTCKKIKKLTGVALPGGFTERSYIKVYAQNIIALQEWAVNKRSDAKFRECSLCTGK